VCTDKVRDIRTKVEKLQSEGELLTLIEARNFNEIVKRYRTLKQARTRFTTGFTTSSKAGSKASSEAGSKASSKAGSKASSKVGSKASSKAY
jgi:hypothetical protein